MSMTITTGDDRDDDVDEPELDDDLDDDDDRPARRGRQADRDDDTDDDDDEDEEKSPEELKAEIKRLRASLAKSNSTGLRRRQQLKELRAKSKELGSRDDDEPDDEEDEEKPKARTAREAGLNARQAQRMVDRAVKAKERELQEQHTRDLIDTRAESALTRAGVSERNIRLLKRELDYDELELTKGGGVTGMDDEIDRLRTEYPDFFKRPKGVQRRINGGDDRESSSRKSKPMSASERQAAALRGR